MRAADSSKSKYDGGIAMTDEELIQATHDARTGAHEAWKNADGTRPTDWHGSSRRFSDLVDEIERRGLDRRLAFLAQSLAAENI